MFCLKSNCVLKGDCIVNYLIPNYVLQSGMIKSMFDENVIKQSDADKVLSVFMYLYAYTTNNGNIRFNLVDLIEKCGFKSRTGIGESNEKFKGILHYLNVNGYFKPNEYDFSKIKPNQFIEVTPQYFDIDDEGGKKSFFVLEQSEIDKINSIQGIDSKKILLLYCSIKSMINPSTKVCYPSVENIIDNILLSEDVIYKYTNELVNINLICYDNAGVFYKTVNGKRKYAPSNNTYILTATSGYAIYLQKSINSYASYMINLGWKRSKKTNVNNREIAGVINRLTHLQSNSGLNKKQEKLLQDAISKRDLIKGEDRIKFENGELLDKNKGKLLSDIFTDMYMDTNANKYYDLELKLELIDCDRNLLVDWDYYKWVMVNYSECEHDKYVNFINSHKRDNENESDELFA